MAETTTVDNAATHAQSVNYLNEEKGLWSWLTTLDHKRISVMYIYTIIAFFIVGGLFALALRIELLTAEQLIFSSDTYNQLMTFHGSIMVFMVIVPGIPAILGNFVMPIMIGAKDVAFPRLNLMSWYCLIIGAAIAIASIFFGGVDTGWTFYTPYSSKYRDGCCNGRVRRLCHGLFFHSHWT